MSPTADPDGRVTPWDVKRLLKLLMTSATYRQSSQDQRRACPSAIRKIACSREGRVFAAQRRRSAIRRLFVSGLLSSKMYGPSVRPPQPKSGLSAAFGPGTDWTDSTGADKYRRGLYTYWRRTTPYPSMVTFDAPSRTVCSVIRPRTNTPLQALVTLNDPVLCRGGPGAGAAHGQRRRPNDRKARSPMASVFAWRGRPAPMEARRLTELFHKARQRFRWAFQGSAGPGDASRLGHCLLEWTRAIWRRGRWWAMCC